MKKATRLAAALAIGLMGQSVSAQGAAGTITARSPDGTLELVVTTDGDARATWSLSRKGQLLIAPSKLGFLLTDGLPMVRGFSLTGSQTASADQTWEQPWGERRFVRDRHNEFCWSPSSRDRSTAAGR